MKVKVGYTGTSKGMTGHQIAVLGGLFDDIKIRAKVKGDPLEFHHGDCVGGDATAHDIARELGYFIVIHPPNNPKKRAFKEGDLILPERDYLMRNIDIVDAVQCMIAAPYSSDEQRRGGTWYTIRYARRVSRPLMIIKPGGRVIKEGGEA